jgi:hypothetical protein
MRIILTILLFISLKAKATNYYISNAGSDAANGITTGTSWQTIAKVNASSFAPGDQILFKSGDTWMEQLIISSSGSSGNLITISSYGTGVKPLITGLKTLTGLTNTSGNIWSATATGTMWNLNTVLINGTIAAKGRYPNTTYLTTYGASNTYTRIETSFTGTPDYTGGELVTHAHNWIVDYNRILSQSGNIINLSTPVTYNDYLTYRYFVQNIPSVLDLQNEWCIDSTTKLLSVYSVGIPTVQYSIFDTLVNLKNNNFLSFIGLSFQGANFIGIKIDSTNSISIKNCSIRYSGRNAIEGVYCNNITVQNDTIENTLNSAMMLFGVFNHADTNYIHNTAIFAGMGKNGNSTYQAIFGNLSTMFGNQIINTGGAGIEFRGGSAFGKNYPTKMYLKNNFIDTFLYNKDDGGGLGTGSATSDSSIVESNIISNGIGEQFIAAGIYLDDNTYGVKVLNNTVINTALYGIFLHVTNKIIATGNTVVSSRAIPFAQQGSSSSGVAGQSYYYNNILYSSTASQKVLSFGYSVGATNMDSNYYLRPVLETNKIIDVLTNNTYSTTAAWSAFYGFDTHGHDTPIGITTALPIVIYNATFIPSVKYFNGIKVDAKGNQYTGAITLQPFTSAILFTSTLPITGRIKNLNFQ